MKLRNTNHDHPTRRRSNKNISSILDLGINSDIPRSCPYNKQVTDQ